MRQNFVLPPPVDVEHKRIAEIVNVEVGLDTALRVEQECVHAMADGKIANVIGGHAIQPAHSIFAGYGNFGATAQVVNTALRQQRPKLGACIAEIWHRSFAAVTHNGLGFCRRSHSSTFDYNEEEPSYRQVASSPISRR